MEKTKNTRMRRLLLLIFFALSSLVTFGQAVNDASLKTYSANPIGVSTYSPTRAKTMADMIIDSKASIFGTYTASGTNAYTVSNVPITSYTAGFSIDVRFTNANTGAATLAIDALGTKSIKKNVTDDLASGDIKANQTFRLYYDGTNFQLGAAISVSFGATSRVPFVNGTGNNFSYSGQFSWDDTNRRLIIGNGNTNNQGTDNYIIGNSSTISAGNWNHILSEQGVIERTSGSAGVGNNVLLSGVNNKITTTSSHPYTGTFNMVLTGGSDNQAIDATQGVGYGGKYNILRKYGPTAGGLWAEAAGDLSWAHGDQEAESFPPSTTSYSTKSVLASGRHSFNFSSNNASQTAGHGALAQNSVILGGRNHNIPSTSVRSVILGGDAIKARASEPDQVYVPNFNIVSAPANDDALTQVLVRDGTTGQIKYRTAGSLGGGGGSGLVDQTLADDIVIDGGTPNSITMGSDTDPLSFFNMFVDDAAGNITLGTSSGGVPTGTQIVINGSGITSETGLDYQVNALSGNITLSAGTNYSVAAAVAEYTSDEFNVTTSLASTFFTPRFHIEAGTGNADFEVDGDNITATLPSNGVMSFTGLGTLTATDNTGGNFTLNGGLLDIDADILLSNSSRNFENSGTTVLSNTLDVSGAAGFTSSVTMEKGANITYTGSYVETGGEGQIQYNATTNKFRANEGGVWKDVIGGGGGSGTVTSIATTSPITGGTITTTGTIGINDAAADGSTKGAASFTAADFNATSGNISIDYTNGQAASASNKGFLTSTDWSTFNRNVLDQTTSSTASGTITLDLNNQIQRIFVGSATFATSKTMALSNSTNALVFNFHFEVTNVAATLVFPSTWLMSDTNFNTGSDTWTPPSTGKYEMGGTYDGTNWKIKISGPFN
jgi:hypothetical protein